MIWVIALLVIMMLSSAIAVLLVESQISALAATSAVSLALSVLFVLLKAPDVAMTEAVVGAGLSTVILALTLRRINKNQSNKGANDNGDYNA